MAERYSHVGENAMTSAIIKLETIDLDLNPVQQEKESISPTLTCLF
jgi:hypothetical protein